MKEATLSQPPRLVAVTLAVTLGTTSAAAAIPEEIDPNSELGMAAKWPVAIIIDGRVALQREGHHAIAPETAPTGLNFGIEGLLGYLNGLTPSGQSGAIDAISTGNALIPMPSGGLPHFGGNWMSITASVTPASPTYGALFGWGNTSVGASLVTYYDDQSSRIDASFNGTTRLDRTSWTLGLGSGTNQNVQGVDYALGLLAYGYPADHPVLLPNDNICFFSVTPHFANSNSGGFAFDPSTSTVLPAHAGDVYLMRRSGSTWIGPTVYARHELLGIDLTSDGNVDALDVDAREGSVLYSVSAESMQYLNNTTHPGGQIMLAKLAHSASGTVPHLVDDPGNEVGSLLTTDNGGTDTHATTEEFSLGSGPLVVDYDVNGLCGIDPESDTTTVTTPTNGATPPVPTELRPALAGTTASPYAGLSAFRVEAGPPADATSDTCDWIVEVSGWGRAIPQRSVVRLEYQLVDVHSGGPTVVRDWTEVGYVVRTATMDRVDFTISDIPSVRGLAPFTADKGRIVMRASIRAMDGSTILTRECRATLYDETQ